MAFPPYVHSVAPDDPAHWPIQPQGVNECGCTAPANALNLLVGNRVFDKDQFIREAGPLFNRAIGGTPSPVTGWLIKRHGFGTHFGALKGDDRERVLRDLIDRQIPVCIELGTAKVAGMALFGEHSVVLVGYSDAYTDAQGQRREEYYFVDAQYPNFGDGFSLGTNDADRDGDGVAEHFPGNRTIDRTTFLADYPTGIYFPVFPNQAAHDAWYAAHIARDAGLPLLGAIRSSVTGSQDHWKG